MNEQLLTGAQVAEVLSLSRRQFYRIHRRLHCDGLLPVRVGLKAVRYRRSDLEKLIKRSAETGRTLGV